MGNKNEYPEWFLWLWEKWIVLFFLIAGFTLLVIGGAVYLDNRFAHFEDQLKSIPPRSYQPPDLTRYQTGKIDQGNSHSRDRFMLPAIRTFIIMADLPCSWKQR